MSAVQRFIGRSARPAAWLAVAATLTACGGMQRLPFTSAERPKPVALSPNVPLLGVRQAWSARIGEVKFPMQVNAQARRLVLANSQGDIIALDPLSGQELWRAAVGQTLSAGVGADDDVAAVVTRQNQLVAVQGGKEIWRQSLPTQTFTAPLVAGGRVFVASADRGVRAFDRATGRQLWVMQRPEEPLVLRQAGVLMAVGDTLVAGIGGRLVGINPNSGAVRWDAAIGAARATNDVERLVDLVAVPFRSDSIVCARSFQTAVGCVDTAQGNTLWSKPAIGGVGLSGDNAILVGAETNGRVQAWSRGTGEVVWSTDRLKFRQLSNPVVLGRSVAVADEAGLVHVLSRDDGSPLNRLTTDGSPIAVSPVLASNTLVVVTQNGSVFGFRPE